MYKFEQMVGNYGVVFYRFLCDNKPGYFEEEEAHCHFVRYVSLLGAFEEIIVRAWGTYAFHSKMVSAMFFEVFVNMIVSYMWIIYVILFTEIAAVFLKLINENKHTISGQKFTFNKVKPLQEIKKLELNDTLTKVEYYIRDEQMFSNVDRETFE